LASLREKHQLIFEPFTQADGSTTRKYGGTGLGLSICSGVVELMEGRIWLESELGKGSTFYFSVTLGIAMAAANQPARPSAPSQRAKRKLRILVAEDNSVNQRLAARLLEREGHSVTIVGCGQDALESFEQQQSTQSQFDLILMDVQMPRSGRSAGHGAHPGAGARFRPSRPYRGHDRAGRRIGPATLSRIRNGRLYHQTGVCTRINANDRICSAWREIHERPI
jgi:CheY-like chemotaxis protein